MFKDHNCTCDEICRCGHCAPCACETMITDPHCTYCMGHLSPGNERAWREDIVKDGFDPDNVQQWLDQWKEEPED
jgi:hypothetical protein